MMIIPNAVARALRAVPCECFLPARIWIQETDEGPYEAIDRVTEPQRWMRAVYVGDHAIVTQFDDGATQWPDRSWRPSCSASQPSVVAGMLEALDIEPGQRVLEVGTGTGYNAALLAEIVGSQGHVLTVQVDGHLVSAARQNLADTGYQDRVEVLRADGATTLTATGSVDRVIATAEVRFQSILPAQPMRQPSIGRRTRASRRKDPGTHPLGNHRNGDPKLTRGLHVTRRRRDGARRDD